jgi:multiple sugar transport system permease protein
MTKKQAYRIFHSILSVLCLIMIFPVFYSLMISFAPASTGILRIIPERFVFSHYVRLFDHGLFGRYIVNSIIYASGGSILSMTVSAMMAYALARMRFAGRNALFGFMFVIMMLPQLTNMVPLYKIASDLKIMNTYGLMIIIFGSFGVPLAVFILKGFFESIPLVLEEAAFIDGATPLQGFVYVVFPIASPGLFATLLINFVYSWNNFFTPLIMITKTNMKMATVGLFDFQHALEGNEDELLAAACVVIMIPAIAIFLAARKYFMRGIVEGAVKG